MNGCEVTILFPEPGIGARLFPAELSEFVNDYYRSKGVEVLAGRARRRGLARRGTASARDEVGRDRRGGRGRRRPRHRPEHGSRGDSSASKSTTASWSTTAAVPADARTCSPPATSPGSRSPALGGARRVEHEDHANTHGRHVGANMAGADAPYDHLPFFYSDLFELGYEAVGDVDSRLDTVAEWAEPNRKGVVCYVEGREAARLPPLGRLGQGRRRPRADRGRRRPSTPESLRALLAD